MMSQEYEYPLLELTLNDPEEFHLLRLTLNQCIAYFLFRGHSNYEWELLSSLERVCLNEAKDKEERDFDGIIMVLCKIR